jgi:hypothetical protein
MQNTNLSDLDFMNLLDVARFHLKLITESSQYQRILKNLRDEIEFYTDLNDMAEGIEEAKAEMFRMWSQEINNKAEQ